MRRTERRDENGGHPLRCCDVGWTDHVDKNDVERVGVGRDGRPSDGLEKRRRWKKGGSGRGAREKRTELTNLGGISRRPDGLLGGRSDGDGLGTESGDGEEGKDGRGKHGEERRKEERKGRRVGGCGWEGKSWL